MTAPAPKMSEGSHLSDPPEGADGPAAVALPADPSVADVLNGAADLIERNGWEQGYTGRAESCAYIAVDRVSRTALALYYPAMQALRHQIGQRSITRWNDTPGRTQAEIVAALRAAAVRAS